MAEETPRVLIADFGHTDISQEIPYICNKAGYVVHAFCPRIAWLLKNSYVDRWIPASNADANSFSQALQNHVRANHYDWVILTDDPLIELIHRTVDDDLAPALLPLSDMTHRAMLGSKAGLSELCSTYGITTPPFFIYRSAADLEEPAIPFPVLVKRDHSSGGHGTYRCDTKEELLRYIASLPEDQRQRLVVQSYIEGTICATEVLYKNGELYGYAYSTVLSTISTEFSASVDRSYKAFPEIEPFLQRIGRELHLSGFCTMTLMRSHADGEHYLIEADMRPQSWFSISRLAGMDFSQALVHARTGIPDVVRPVFPAGVQEITLRHFPRDVTRAIRDHDVKKLFAWCTNRDGCWRFVPWYDPVVVWGILTDLARYYVLDYKQRSRVIAPVYRKVRRWCDQNVFKAKGPS